MPVVCEFCRMVLFAVTVYATLVVNRTKVVHHVDDEPYSEPVVFTWTYCDVSCLHADWSDIKHKPKGD